MRRLMATSAAAAMLIAAISGHAAESLDAQTLDSMTVTANKRSENIQETPVTVSAFSAADLEEADVHNMDDLMALIPNMKFNNMFMNGTSSSNFRGLNFSPFTNTNPVVIFIDGVPMDNYMGYNLDLVNIERVEVLRGPQGTLYGKNAIGGIINIFTKKPGNTTEGQVTVEVAENATYRATTSISGPLTEDGLSFGISSTYRRTDGFMENDNPKGGDVDDKVYLSINPQLRWAPSERFEANLKTGYEEVSEGSGTTVNAANGPVRHVNVNPDDSAESETFRSSLHTSYKGDTFDTTTITTFSDTKKENDKDFSFGNVPLTNLYDGRTQNITQELRFSSSDAKGLQWVTGLYFAHQKEDADVYGYEMGGTLFNTPHESKETTLASFGQMTVPLGALAFTAGLRYEHVKKEVEGNGINMATMAPYQIDVSNNWDTLLPKAAISWTLSEDAMVYTSVAQGYLAGGYNVTEPDKEAGTFDEQTSTNYELGIKTSWLNNRLLLNSNIFYIAIDDMHVFSSAPGNMRVAGNAGKAHSQGIELEMRARPIQGLDLMANLGFVDAEYNTYKTTDGTTQRVYSGNTIEHTPQYSLNVSAQYRLSSGLYLRGEMEGYGKSYFDPANQHAQGAYQLYNLKVGYEFSRWDLYLYGNNLTDKRYFSSGFDVMQNRIANVGAPRTFGVKVTHRF